MQAVVAIVGTIFGAVIVYNLVRNVGTSAKPQTAVSDITGALSSTVSSLTNSK